MTTGDEEFTFERQVSSDELLRECDRLTLPGTYAGVAMADYLALPALSAGVIKDVVNYCPAAGWHSSYLNPNPIDDSSAASDAGSIAHSILLCGGDLTLCTEIDPRDYPSRTTGSIPDGWTNKSIRAARDLVRASGKIPILSAQMGLIRGMVESMSAFIESMRVDEPAIWAAFQPDAGDSELTCLWDDDGLLCRMRPDRMSTDRRVIVDPKFTKRSAEPESFARTQFSAMGYRISAAFYRRGARALFGTLPDYVFLVCEQDPPHLCSAIGLDPVGLALGDAQVAYGMSAWREGLQSGLWPAYSSRVAYPETPIWERGGWLDDDRFAGATSGGIPYDVEKLFQKEGAP